MSLKPVDFQVMMPKTNEMSRVEIMQRGKEHAALQQKTISAKNETDNKSRQVTKRNRAEEARINNYNKRDSNKRDNDNNKKKKNSKTNFSGNKNNGYDEHDVRHIDIRL